MALAVDGDRVCWVTGPEHGKLYVASRITQNAAPKHHNLSWVRDLCLRGNDAYLACDRGVLRAPLDGGQPRELAGRDEAATCVLAGADFVVWLERRSGSVWRASLAGAAPERLATGPRGATAMVLLDAHVYWTAGQAGQLLRVPRAGGGAEVVVRADHPLTDLATDGRRLYWCTPSAVMTLAADGVPAVVVGDQATPAALAVSAAALAWVNGVGGQGPGAGAVMAVPHGRGQAQRTVVPSAVVQALCLWDRTLYWADQSTRAIVSATLET